MTAPNPDKEMNVIHKVKLLTNQLQDSLNNCTKVASQAIIINNSIDSGNSKQIDFSKTQMPKFDKQIEEFFAICDQIECHLKTAIECSQQGTSSSHFLPYPVNSTRVESGPSDNPTSMSYPAMTNLAASQISYLKQLNELLRDSKNRDI